ncbi:MAG: hypothetical protein KatS3mg124_1248 [Porticoccaceae bacterium]|nr:MAG: hypothetical protein KatS3mg124_1248 [Porticoccaceae bacterium]
MSAPRRRAKLPWRLIALDAAGALLVAAGFYRYLREEGGAWEIALGFALMLPLALHLVRGGRPH